MLHGYGSDENDLFSFADYLPNKYNVISIRAPFETPMGGFVGSQLILIIQTRNGLTQNRLMNQYQLCVFKSIILLKNMT